MKFFSRSILLSLLSICIGYVALSQGTVPTICGYVRDINGDPIQYANVALQEYKIGAETNVNGYYELKVSAGISYVISYSYIGKNKKMTIDGLKPGEKRKLNVTLDVNINMNTVEVKTNSMIDEKVFMQKMDSRLMDHLPATGEKVTMLVKTLPGVSSQNELSSNYTVRGGNYDENLVYINDVEIYRPFLIRSGQQEGLPIINSDLVESIKFSAGGFEAKYGDKLASVLDIKYKEPKKFAGSFSASFMGLNGHLEGCTDNHRLKYLLGVRQYTNKYMLSSLDVTGDYNSDFLDIQSYVSYDINEKMKIGWFSYYGNNKYLLVPASRETNYGTMNLKLRFKVYFDGQELTSFQNYLNAVDLSYNLKDSTSLKFIASAYSTTEKEYYDVEAQYWLAQVDNDPGSKTFDQAKVNLGVGTYINHARNKLNAQIFSLKHIGEHKFKKSVLLWGVQAQNESISDYVREWRMLDSADFCVPITPDSLALDYFLKSKLDLRSFRYSGYLQDNFMISDSSSTQLSAGIRASYWDFNNEFFVTPRLQIGFMPYRRKNLRALKLNPTDSTISKNMQFKASIGMYYQPVFYRELRNRQGVLNPEIRAQKSYQVLIGTDMLIKMWDRPFKLTAEAYYKYLTDIIPYDVEDIRVKYYGKNIGKGYATGLDLQIYGEFVKGLPSWANLSIMSTQENLTNTNMVVTDGYKLEPHITNGLFPIITFTKTVDKNADTTYTQTETGYIPRPTDQRFRFSLFFQDFLPNNPTYKVNLNFVYATGLPFGPPNNAKYRNHYRMPAYKRIDIGFSKLLLTNEVKKNRKVKMLNYFSTVWLTAEIYNLFGYNNTISYFWVKDVNSNLWGVPNYLTARRYNVNLTVKF